MSTVFIPSCANRGGDASLIRLVRAPRLDVEAPLDASAPDALARWRARPGEVLTVVDPDGVAYRARITCLEPGAAACLPFRRLATPVESPLRLTVCQALPSRERFELVLQKLTELGAAGIVPMETARSATLAERDAPQKKSHRWPEVVSRAARQCRRAMLPELSGVLDFDAALAAVSGTELKLMLYEGEVGWSLREGIGAFRPQSVALLVGPEGGFAAEEVEQAQTHGFLPVALGPRILRTETAAIVAAALVQGYLGDLA